MTTFLLEMSLKSIPVRYRKGSFRGARALIQLWDTLRLKCPKGKGPHPQTFKSAQCQRQSEWKDSILVSHLFERESQKRSEIRSYLEMKVCIFQILRQKPISWGNLREDLFQVNMLNSPLS